MRIFMIAGEASGDMHGSNLAKALLQSNPGLEIHGWGGELMKEAGVLVLKNYRELAFMGFWEVAKNIQKISRNFATCKVQINSFKPDAIIFIDYPGFNLRMAKWSKMRGLQNYYYISPQLWAWKSGRIKTIRKYIDRMITILPFEPTWYKKRGMEVDYVGHPLIEVIDAFEQDPHFTAKNKLSDRPIIALLPGSRKQEIDKILPEYLNVVNHFRDYQFVVAGAPNIHPELYQKHIRNLPVRVVFGQTYNLLSNAVAACVTSGTATLESALFNVPILVGYKGGTISYHIAKRVIKVKYISLVNLIADDKIVNELIQKDLNEENLKKHLAYLLKDEGKNEILRSYQPLRSLLGQGNSSRKAADIILAQLMAHLED